MSKYIKEFLCISCNGISRGGVNSKYCRKCRAIKDEDIRINNLLNAKELRYKKNLEPICIFCKEKDGQKLEVHHIDKNHSNNKGWNLLVLCKRCHRRLHSKIYKLIFYKEKYKHLYK